MAGCSSNFGETRLLVAHNAQKIVLFAIDFEEDQ
ncbi:MAG: hypothetical protein M2R45_02341 [Verrucomicrobia subdivision 3 bacterium]|nr:hypothetical protein [Limisphaerales bacterium]MCS1414893.1 hypothetical protein [Limisphaerales bacterium]